MLSPPPPITLPACCLLVPWLVSGSVGVGTADFSFMEQLDGDDVRIANAQGTKASRDIVQFVPFREFTNKGFHALAREVSFFSSKYVYIVLVA